MPKEAACTICALDTDSHDPEVFTVFLTGGDGSLRALPVIFRKGDAISVTLPEAVVYQGKNLTDYRGQGEVVNGSRFVLDQVTLMSDNQEIPAEGYFSLYLPPGSQVAVNGGSPVT